MHSVDDRQADSTYVAAAVVSSLALLVIHFVGWSFARPAEAGIAVLLAAEAVVILAYCALAFAGRDPAITVSAGTSALTIVRGSDKALTLPYGEIRSARRIDAQTFHRHYRRYAETRAFVNHVPGDLLLLHWNGVPVVLGLADDDLTSVLRMLERRASAGRASSHVGAA